MTELTFSLSWFCRLDIRDQGVGRAGCLWGLSPWLVDGHLLTESSHVFSLCTFLCPDCQFITGSGFPPQNFNHLLKSPVIFWGARGWDFSMIISWIYNSAHRNFLEKILCKEDKPGSSWRRPWCQGRIFSLKMWKPGVVTYRRNDLEENKLGEKGETY